MVKKLILIFIVMFSLFSLSACADVLINPATEFEQDSFKLSYAAIKDRLTVNEKAEFEFNLTGKTGKNNRLRFFVEDVQWDIFTVPTSHKLSGAKIYQNSTTQTKLSLKPSINIKERQTYIVDLNVKMDNSDEEVSIPLIVYVKSLEPYEQKYKPDVWGAAMILPAIDPREEIVVDVSLRNRNNRNITEDEAVIVLQSKTLGKRRIPFSLNALGQDGSNKSVEIKFKLDSLNPPGNDTLEGQLFIDDTKITLESRDFVIIDYTGEFDEELMYFNDSYKTETQIIFTNNGNVARTQVYNIDKSTIAAWFTKLEPEADITDIDGGKSYTWNLDLQPGESQTIRIKTNYSKLVHTIELLLLIAVVLIVLYFLFRSPLTIKKQVFGTEQKEGGLSEVKVRLNIVNIGKKMIKHIEIVDHIPNIAEIGHEFHIGTVKPTQVLKHETRKDTIIKWHIDDLEPLEHRIITYRLKSKLSIVGGLNLPAAKVKFQRGNKKVSVFSNKLFIKE